MIKIVEINKNTLYIYELLAGRNLMLYNRLREIDPERRICQYFKTVVQLSVDSDKLLKEIIFPSRVKEAKVQDCLFAGLLDELQKNYLIGLKNGYFFVISPHDKQDVKFCILWIMDSILSAMKIYYRSLKRWKFMSNF